MTTHWTLEQFNMMKQGHVDQDERTHLVEHLLGCQDCTTRFRMMNDLDSKLKKQEKHPWRYAVGVAAVMFMASYPYFTTPQTSILPEPMQQIAMADSGTFGILDQVQGVNFNTAVASWGAGTSVNDLLRIQNK